MREEHGGDGGGREREEGKQTVVVCKDSGQSEVNWFESEGHLHSTGR